ncbi:STAS-like domain-containing protein [Kiloniella antarctica]|uniref:STAS-like domain-containing protein n=1 Tax=Kiloniella antarctica TaxID=1550907 RepID=A0ABW5BM65_9PROT
MKNTSKLSNSMQIKIAEDFSKAPAGRYESDGPANGTTFRKKILEPNLRNKDLTDLYINFDDTYSYGSSFLEEAFGGLIRESKIPFKDLEAKLHLEAEKPAYKRYCDLAWRYINAEEEKHSSQALHT